MISSSTVNRIVPLLEKYLPDMPRAFALGWIEKESGGRNDVSSPIGERGWFQIGKATASDWGIDLARVGSDEDYSVAQTARLIRNWMSKVPAIFEPDTDAYWGMVKLWHALPLLAKKTGEAASKSGIKPVSWPDVVTIAQSSGVNVPGHDANKWLANPGKVLDLAKSYDVGGALLASAKETAKAIANPWIGLPIAGLLLLLLYLRRQS